VNRESWPGQLARGGANAGPASLKEVDIVGFARRVIPQTELDRIALPYADEAASECDISYEMLRLRPAPRSRGR